MNIEAAIEKIQHSVTELLIRQARLEQSLEAIVKEIEKKDESAKSIEHRITELEQTQVILKWILGVATAVITAILVLFVNGIIGG